jgi:hypothetical protein
MTLDEALDTVAVCEAGELNEACEAADMGTPHPEGCHTVVTDDGGCIAYFREERAAYEYRLFLVNQILNAPKQG